MMKANCLKKLSLGIIVGSLSVAVSYAVDGTWITTSAPSAPFPAFGSAANWEGGVVADGGVMYLSAPTNSVSLNMGNPTLSGISALGGEGWGTWGYSIGRLSGSSALTLVASGGLAPSVDLSAAANNGSLRLNVPLIANSGVRFSGNGSGTQTIILSPSAPNSISGGVEISGVSLLLQANIANALGANQEVTLSGNNSKLVKATGGDATWANSIVLNSKTSGIQIGATGTLTLSGNISEVAGSESNLVYSATIGGYRFVVTGSNSYTGDTVIGQGERVFVRITNGQALGAGASTVSFGSSQSSLELNAAGSGSSGFTVADKKLVLSGAGNGGNGQLMNYSGNNTWAGDIEIAAGESGHVSAFHFNSQVTTLTVTGQISDNATSNGLFKKGTGILRLTGVNTYGSGTTIEAGWIYAANNSALGVGDLTIESNAGLRVEAGVHLAGISALNLRSAARIAFDVSSGISEPLLIAASQTGDGIYIIDLLNSQLLGMGSYVLINVTGSYEASGFILGDATFGENLIGELEWGDGSLKLNIQAIPEPASSMALLGCAALIVGFALRNSRKKRVAIV